MMIMMMMLMMMKMMMMKNIRIEMMTGQQLTMTMTKFDTDM